MMVPDVDAEIVGGDIYLRGRIRVDTLDPEALDAAKFLAQAALRHALIEIARRYQDGGTAPADVRSRR